MYLRSPILQKISQEISFEDNNVDSPSPPSEHIPQTSIYMVYLMRLLNFFFNVCLCL